MHSQIEILLPALGTAEAFLMIGVSKHCHHFSLCQFPTSTALAAKETLVIFSTVVVSIFGIKSIHRQLLLTFLGNNTNKLHYPW